MADTPTGFAGAATTIRETGKWLLLSFGAIGAVLIAGVEFSGIAKLKSPQLEQALASGALGLFGLGLAITGVSSLLLPRSYTLRELAVGTGNVRKVRDKLNARAELLGGWLNVAALADALDEALGSYQTALQAWKNAAAANKAAAEQLLNERTDALNLVTSVTRDAGDWGNYLALRMDYGRALYRRVLPGVVIAVVGFAGVLLLAAGPSPDPTTSLSKITIASGASFVNAGLAGADFSKSKMPGVDFTGADLSGANLSEAVFTGAIFTSTNLRGANLTDASLDGATWGHTICPDGENSDEVGGSCQAHLTVPVGSPKP